MALMDQGSNPNPKAFLLKSIEIYALFKSVLKDQFFNSLSHFECLEELGNPMQSLTIIFECFSFNLNATQVT